MKPAALIPLALLLAATLAQAHVVLEQKSAIAGSYYKATFMVGHGCGGSPTTGIEIEMPEAMAVVKPMPKPGWKLVTQSAPAPAGMSLHGRTVAEVVTRVSWRGGPLEDAHYDEFVVLLQLPKREGPLYFKVVQRCGSGRNDWVEVPEVGRTGRFRMPAAVLELQPAAPTHHRH
ncbi:MAG: YcnI family protein [Burkholderiales bacterium]|nr:YcnI family protein [Burkholderiales bacterium]